MDENVKHDEIMLGFGHGYISIAESLLAQIKSLREELSINNGIDFPAVHVVDHDYDSERNIVWLPENEFVIRIFGVEKVRCQCDEIQPNFIINELKKVALENISQLSQ